ncbi:hypothetical protein DFH11DRAFT_1130799 [Phellopilus nigrolimitatus]|nr:hypothetical protein DFH11DRAFT_1130799 [Phellopilus nigrolimitatus]
MSLLDLPNDVIAEILDHLYKEPNSKRNRDAPRCFKKWEKRCNAAIFVLSQVCRYLYDCTFPLRFRYVYCNSLDDLLGLVRRLEKSVLLQRSVRYLALQHLGNTPSITEPCFRELFPDLLPELLGLQYIMNGEIKHDFLACLGRCRDLRYLHLTCSCMETGSVASFNQLSLVSLQVTIYNQRPEASLPIKELLAGPSRDTLRNLGFSCFEVNTRRFYITPAMFIPDGVPLRGLRSFSMQGAIETKKYFLADTSEYATNLEALDVELWSSGALDPERIGSWPSLKRLCVEYNIDSESNLESENDVVREGILSSAPSIEKAVLKRMPYASFKLLCRDVRSYGVSSTLRVLSIHFLSSPQLLPEADFGNKLRLLFSSVPQIQRLSLWAIPGREGRMWRLEDMNDCISAFSSELCYTENSDYLYSRVFAKRRSSSLETENLALEPRSSPVR